MNIFEKIKKLENKGIIIDYMAIDQIEGGMKNEVENGDVPRITYTVYVKKIDGEEIHCESEDTVKEALITGIIEGEKYLKKNI